MAEETYVNINGIWRSVNDINVRVGGAWKTVEDAWLYQGGAWKQVYSFDTTGPVAATGFVAYWTNSSGPRCYVSWTQPSSSDLAYTILQRSINGGASWTTLYTYYNGPNTVLSYTDTNVTLSNYTLGNQASAVHYYRIIPYDTRGNQGTIANASSKGQDSSLTRGYLTSPYYLNSSASNTYLGGNGQWVSDVSSGYQTVFGNGRRLGHFYYDNDSYPHELKVTYAEIIMKRGSSFGSNTAIPVKTRGSYMTYLDSAFGDPPPNAFDYFPYLDFAVPSGSYNYGTEDWATVSNTVAHQIVRNGYNSIVIDAEQDAGNPYSSEFSDWYNSGNGWAYGFNYGTLRVYHTG